MSSEAQLDTYPFLMFVIIATNSIPPGPAISGSTDANADTRPSSFLEVARRRLLDPRTIAEQHQPGEWENLQRERTKLAEDISRITAEIRGLSAQHDDLRKEISALKQHLRDLRKAVSERSNTLISRFQQLFGLDYTLTALLEKVEERARVLAETSTTIKHIDRERSQAERQLEALPDPDRAISWFADEIVLTPLSKEERRELLRPEVLQRLSLEEYVQVWRRINPYYVSHVTRQGLRDHNAMIYHSAGMYQYHNGFGAILRDGQELRAPRVVQDALDPTCRKSIEQFLT